MPNNSSTPEMTSTSSPLSDGQTKSTTVSATEQSPSRQTDSPATVPGRVEVTRDADNSGGSKKPDSSRTDQAKGEQKPL